MSDLNDPRVLFAAERTLLAWNRTSVSLMALGFVVERFGLFLEIVNKQELRVFQRHLSFLIGVTFILAASLLAGYSVLQYKRFLKTLRPVEIPEGYNTTFGLIVNALVSILGLVLMLYVFHGML